MGLFDGFGSGSVMFPSQIPDNQRHDTNSTDEAAADLTDQDLEDARKEEQLFNYLHNTDKYRKVTDKVGNEVLMEGGGENLVVDSLVGTNEQVSEQVKEAEKKLIKKSDGKKQPEFKKQGGILRYPLEGMTQHTDYLQIDIVEYKPVGREKKMKERGHSIPLSNEYMDTKEGAKHAKNLSSKKFVSQSSRYTGEGFGFRRNTINNTSASRTRPFGLATRPLINAGTILLPVPSNVQDGNAVKYGDSSLNGLQAAGASAIMDVMRTDVRQGWDAISGSVSSGIANFQGQTKAGVGTLERAQSLALNKLTASALGIFGGNVTTNQLFARQTGEIINPNMELLFDGPTLRAFKFQFKMTPRNAREAKQCRLIIRAFKRNMAPRTGGTSGDSNWFLKTPNVFELRYRTGNKDHPFLHKFKQCFLTDVAVNYTGEGVYSTYDDATPTSMTLDLSFKELEPIYDTDYDSPQGATAVGY